MKKTLILASILIFATSMAAFAAPEKTVQTEGTTRVKLEKPNCKMVPPPAKGPDFQKRHEQFEKRLNLTDEQKAKAKELREQGFEQMKPIMEKIKEKQKEAFELQKNGDTAQLEQVKKQLGTLKHEAHELRMQNMKKFEGLLTAQQKKELKKMKDEGRKNFEKNMKNMKKHPRPDFKQGPGRPGFGPARPGFGPGHAEIPPQPPVKTEVK